MAGELGDFHKANAAVKSLTAEGAERSRRERREKITSRFLRSGSKHKVPSTSLGMTVEAWDDNVGADSGFHADLADAADQIVGGGFAWRQSDDIDGRGLTVGTQD